MLVKNEVYENKTKCVFIYVLGWGNIDFDMIEC